MRTENFIIQYQIPNSTGSLTDIDIKQLNGKGLKYLSHHYKLGRDKLYIFHESGAAIVIEDRPPTTQFHQADLSIFEGPEGSAMKAKSSLAELLKDNKLGKVV